MGILAEQTRCVVEEAIRARSPLVWLDKAGEFAPLVARWKVGEEGFPFPVFSFEGSYLEVMTASRQALSAKRPANCLVYLKGFDEEDVRRIPLYETCKAGRTWRTTLERIIREAGQGRLSGEQIDYVLSRGRIDIAEAERVVAGLAERPPELESLIAKRGEDGLVAAFLEKPLDIDIDLSILADYFNRAFGFDADWRLAWNAGDQDSAEPGVLADAIASYILCAEYARDLVCPPPSARLKALAAKAPEYGNKVRRFLRELRIKKPDLYAVWAERVENELTDAERNLAAEDLGKIDTFKFEADITINAAIDALNRKDWARAEAYAQARLALDAGGGEDENAARTFWVKRDPARDQLWRWIFSTSLLGKEIASVNASTDQPASLLSAFNDYTADGWRTDQLHRRYLLMTARLNTATVPNRFGDFIAIRREMNRSYRAHADALAERWSGLCVKDGFLGPREFAQRRFFERYVRPALRIGTKTALVLVDALRYELGAELARLLADYADGANPLSALLAELPTVTAVGMNALMPAAADGVLKPVFDKAGKKIVGFNSGQRQITDPDSRLKALAEYSADKVEWTELDKFLDSQGKELARLASAGLLVIATRDIDDMGEGDAGRLGIDYFEPVLARLKQAVEKLRDQGFQRILITADHGFLLGDETVENGRAARLEKVDRRYAFDDDLRNGDALVSVRLSALDYQLENTALALVLERTTHLLSSAKAGTFYHGGNSPQERVIPVITLTGGGPRQPSPGTYGLRVEALPPVFGNNRVVVVVHPDGPGELFGPETVELRLSGEPGTRLLVGDAGGMRFTGDTIEAPIDRPIIVTFRLESPEGGRSRLELRPTGRTVKIAASLTADYFTVERAGKSDAVSADTSTHNLRIPSDRIPEEYHTALQHLHKHGALTEAFLRNTLGGTPEASRKARRFAQNIADWMNYLPFKVGVRYTADGTEYRKE